MALTPEDLQAIEAVFDRKMDEKLAPVKEELAEIKDELAEVKEEVAEIKEHAEVTRAATNSLVELAENVSVITQVKFPVKK